MKKRRIFLLTGAGLLLLSPVFAGNLKKLYINLSKDGQQAQTSDVPGQYNAVETKSASLVYDSAGNAHGWYVAGGTTKIAGPSGFGHALQFDTSVGSGIRLPDNAVATSLQDFTIEAWIKGDGVGFSNYANNRNNWGDIFGAGVSCEDLMFAPVSNKLALYLRGIGSTTSDSTLPLDRWMHVGVVRKGTNITFYLDGKPFGNVKTIAAATGNINLSNGSSYRCIAHDYSNYTSEEFVGSLDEVRVWKVAKTSEQIAKSYNHPLTLSEMKEGLIGYWTFDQ